MSNNPDNESTKPTNLLNKAMANSGLSDLAADIGEIALDKNIQDEFFKEVPILKTVYTLFKIGSNINELSFKNKLYKFLKGFREADAELRNKIETALPNPHDRDEMAQHLLMALQRFDQITKAEALCKLFIARIDGIISERDFKKLTVALDRIDVNDVDILKEFYNGNISGNEERDVLRSFAFVQLVSVDYSGRPTSGQIYPRSGGGDEKFNKNSLGEKFVTALVR